MFQLFKADKTINFMRLSKWTFLFSGLMIAASIFSLSTKWFNWGLDFTGGTVIEVNFEQPPELAQLRQVLSEDGFSDAMVQNFGSSQDIMVRLRPRTDVKGEIIGQEVLHSLQRSSSEPVTMKRIEFVGPSVGEELATSGALAILVSLLCIMAYVAMRFEIRLAVGAVLALFHDVIITIGIFSYFQIEIDLTIVAALLTLVGYSLNDTIVVFDRIRESFRKIRGATTSEIMDISITQTLTRTTISSLLTLFVVVALFFKGGENIHGFALALLLGITIGTYSSIYIASAIALRLGLNREHLMPTQVEKEGADQEGMLP